MTDVILFGGTSEGRELAALLGKRAVRTLVCVATGYGARQVTGGESVSVECGRLQKNEMAALFKRESPHLVIDATHPYAREASENIKSACRISGIRYIRVLRDAQEAEGCTIFEDEKTLAGWLDGQPGRIFSALGVKEAALMSKIKDFEKRVWLRILPDPGGLAECLALGFLPEHIICMQGPFSAALNEAMFCAAKADILVTKESGSAGGYAQKIQAAYRCGMRVALLARPPEEEGLSLAEMCKKIEECGI